MSEPMIDSNVISELSVTRYNPQMLDRSVKTIRQSRYHPTPVRIHLISCSAVISIINQWGYSPAPLRSLVFITDPERECLHGTKSMAISR